MNTSNIEHLSATYKALTTTQPLSLISLYDKIGL